MQVGHAKSPFQAWNLRRNPFGELTFGERAELAVVEELAHWLEILRRPRTALQFVGDCGHGKTTHLLALHRSLGNSVYVYYPETGPRPKLPTVRPLLIDEAQRMGHWNRWRLMRGKGPIVVATHIDLARQLRKFGFETVSVDMNAPMHAETLSRILNRRIEASRWMNRDPSFEVDILLAEGLLAKFHSNVRAIEGFLYESLQATLTGRASWPPVI